jgi:hypothetical protein
MLLHTLIEALMTSSKSGMLGNNTMKCLENLLTSNALRDTLCSESYKRGGENAGILHEVQKEG